MKKLILLFVALISLTGFLLAQEVSRQKPLNSGKNREIIESQKIDIPADIKKETLIYAKYDEEEIKLSVYTKDGLKNAPLIISIHGGGFTSGDENTTDSIAVPLVEHGYVVVAPTYRKPQRLRKDAEVKSKWRVADCVADVNKALDWSLANAQKYAADTKKIGVIGYLELGMFPDAEVELDAVDPDIRHLPEVLAVRMEIYSKQQEWERMQGIAERLMQNDPKEPQWAISCAFATRRAKSIEAAKPILLEALRKYPRNPLIRFNLACYECQLGNLESAKRYLKQAIKLAPDFRKIGLEDEDLKPLWDSLATEMT